MAKPVEEGDAAAWLARRLDRAGASLAPVLKRAVEDGELLAAMFDALESGRARVKYGASKALWQLAGSHPHLLYPGFDFFLDRLDHPNNVMRWTAAATLARLAPADSAGRVEACLDRYLSHVQGPKMIMAAHVMAGGAKIAAAKPHLAGRIGKAILGVERGVYDSEACGQVAAGHALTALAAMLPLLEDARPVFAFARRQLESPRPAVRKKAEKLLRAAVGNTRPRKAAAR